MRHLNAARRQFCRQGTHGQIGLLGQTREKPLPGFAYQDSPAMTTDLAGKQPTARALPLTDPHR